MIKGMIVIVIKGNLDSMIGMDRIPSKKEKDRTLRLSCEKSNILLNIRMPILSSRAGNE